MLPRWIRDLEELAFLGEGQPSGWFLVSFFLLILNSCEDYLYVPGDTVSLEKFIFLRLKIYSLSSLCYQNINTGHCWCHDLEGISFLFCFCPIFWELEFFPLSADDPNNCVCVWVCICECMCIYMYVCVCVRMCLECVCMSVYMWWWCLGEGDLDEVAIFILLPFLPILSHKATPFYRWKHWILVNRKSFLPDDTSRQTSLQTLCLSSQEAFRLVTVRAVVQWVLRLILKQVMCPSWCSDPNMRQRL